ncbi:NACHT domain-containing protein [Nonomuraea sp. NPDC050556]|uniref:NACHT domain-containing protein n=1 Tax=Nonomuraea sp. NPDC050556 TaxID=3364369 RepID=UPI00379B9924
MKEPSVYDLIQGWPAWVVGALVVLLFAKPLIEAVTLVLKTVRSGLRLLSPARYTPAARAEADRRRGIARLLRENLDWLEEELRWERDSFAEMRVTIVALDRPRRTRSGLLGLGGGLATFSTRSLSKALGHEPNRRVLLQGGPGSGKSVALRHYARAQLDRAIESRFSPVPLALCVSLRDLQDAADKVTARSLRDYIVRQVNAADVPALTDYFDQHFDADLNAGRILLLLDSFDEIPAVLGSSNIDEDVRPYAKAITSLIAGGTTRCVLASREYKGPKLPDWTRLEIVGLQIEEQEALLRGYGAAPEPVEALLRDPRLGFAADLRNPLYLSLLARFLNANGSVPARPSELFEDYARAQFSGLPPVDRERVLEVVQDFAFRLARSPDTGLVGDVSLVGEWLEVVRKSRLLIETRDHRLAFVHRRVQEYFATQYVLRHPGELSARELALNGRWRETAVALLQTGAPEDVASLLDELERSLAGPLDELWPREAIHVLELLVAAGSPERLPARLRDLAGELIVRAWVQGGIGDRKFALDCVPIVAPELQLKLIEDAFAGTSQWLRRSALRDCSAIHPLPPTIEEAIRRLLVTMVARGQLSDEGALLDADLGRIHQKRHLVRARKVLARVPITVTALWAAGVSVAAVGASMSGNAVLLFNLFLLLIPLGYFWSFQSSEPLSYPSTTRLKRFLQIVGDDNKGGTDTTGQARTLLWTTTILMGWVASGGVLLLWDRLGLWWTLGCTVAALVFSVYVMTWGPAVLYGVRYDLFGERVRFGHLLVPMIRALPEMGRGMRGFGVARLGALAREVPGMLLVMLVFGGLIYLVTEFAKIVGQVLFAVMIGIGVLYVLSVLLSEIRSRWRVRRAAATPTLTDEEFLTTVLGLDDPLDVAEYVRVIRTRPEALRGLSRELVRDLSKLIEHPRDLDVDLHPVLRAAVDDLRLGARQLELWRGDVLDELGQVDEFLRER